MAATRGRGLPDGFLSCAKKACSDGQEIHWERTSAKMAALLETGQVPKKAIMKKTKP